MKPGKPFSFGMNGRVPVFGLPGNPVSTFVAFELFVRPALLAMQGVPAAAIERPRAPVALARGYRKQRRSRALHARARRAQRRAPRRAPARQARLGDADARSSGATRSSRSRPTRPRSRPDALVPALLLEAV